MVLLVYQVPSATESVGSVCPGIQRAVSSLFKEIKRIKQGTHSFGDCKLLFLNATM